MNKKIEDFDKPHQDLGFQVYIIILFSLLYIAPYITPHLFTNAWSIYLYESLIFLFMIITLFFFSKKGR